MSQRDYEEQPEAPDLAQVVQEDTEVTLVGPPQSDALDAGYIPPDRPYVAEDHEALAGGEDLDGRLRRERPGVDPDGTAGTSSETDLEPDRAPRFEPAEPTPDTRYTEPVEATAVGLAGGAASAEEAAMHVRDENDPKDGAGYDPEGDR
jgi:hypothetical protein